MKLFNIIVFLFSYFITFAQTDPKIIFDKLVNSPGIDIGKWPHPNSNSSKSLTSAGSNNAKTIQISGFDPICQVIRISDPKNYPNSVQSVAPWSSIGTINGNNKEYKIQYQYEHEMIPNRASKQDEYFEFKFKVTNNLATNGKLSYVIFYQNESYYYSENSWNVLLSGDNYYGSWGYNEQKDTEGSGFRSISVPFLGTKEIKGLFRITGNSKNDPIYCDPSSDFGKWKEGNQPDYLMNRWGAPPRMGNYKFLVVVTSEPNSITLPFLTDVSKKYNGKYYTPFYWRNCINTNFTKSTAIAESDYCLKIYAKPNLKATLNPKAIMPSPFTHTSFHTWDNFLVDQLPIVQDIEDYTQLDYNFNKQFGDTISDIVKVRIDYFDENKIDWKQSNPGNAYPDGNGKILISTPPSNCETGEFKREHAGINYSTQKYGKFTALIQFPKMYTRNQIWKGINNTFWFANTHGVDTERGRIYCGDKGSTIWHTEFDIEYFPGGTTPYNNINETNNLTKQYSIAAWDNQKLTNDPSSIPITKLYSLDVMYN
jgi:hypothetical protein